MSKRVVIVGGGVIGLCAAHSCIERGHEVTVIDCGSCEDGCSYGNAGMIVPSHVVPLAAPGVVRLGLQWMWNPESPFWVKPRLSWELLDWGLKFWRSATADHVRRSAVLLRDLHLASRSCFEELAAECGNEFGLERKGLLMLCNTQAGLDEEAEAARLAGELGVPGQVFDALQTAALDPTIAMSVIGSVFFPDDCHLQPAKLMSWMKQRLASAGVRWLINQPVIGWETRGGSVQCAVTSRGSISGDEFVVASGVWSPALVRQLGLRLPMQAGKGYSLTLGKPPRLPALPSILVEARVAVTPMGSSLRVGGTMEIGGNDESITQSRIRGIINSISRYFPEFRASDFDGIQPWAGLRPCSPDGLPYLGRVGNRNLLIATGHAMMGLSLAPITGRIVGELITDGRSEFDLTMLSPLRFTAKQWTLP